ncbi:MAG: 3-phosphoshikimate 1-carboxyvinyltransferase [Phycisphaerales bacterium]
MPSESDPLRLPLERLPGVLTLPHARSRGRPVTFDVRPPGSKSLTNRALLLAALAAGESTLGNAQTDGDDTRRMIEALRTLGADVRVDERSALVRVWGLSGRPRSSRTPGGASLQLGNAGTAMRFLAAAAALADAPVTLDGNDRMRQRPIGELGDALGQLGARVEYLAQPGFPPLRVHPAEPGADPTVTLGTTASSQFISALLMAGTFLPGGLTVKLTGETTSPSYIRMTLWLLARLGAWVQSSDDLRVIRVRGVGKAQTGLASFRYDVEPDASAATYFLGAAALLPGVTCRVLGLSHLSVQGDARFAPLLARMGALTQHETGAGGGPRADAFISVTGAGPVEPILADMGDMPDAAMTLASVACFANGTSILRGLRTLRVKESDRIEAMRKELTKLGVRVENPVSGDDGAVTITPPQGGIDCSPSAPRVELDTYDDHRMAMALSLIALRRPHTGIRNPACVAKTYPAYWRDLADLLDAVGSG